MTLHESLFPTMSVDEIALNNKDNEAASKELYQTDPIADFHIQIYSTSALDLIKERYKFSNYMIDPNYRRFHTVIRILSLALLFIRNMQRDVARRKKGEPKSAARQTLEYVFVKEEYVNQA